MNMMKFLNRDVEKLLCECLERSDDFPAILAEKLERASVSEDNHLRSCIKVLCDEGYFSKLGWGDNVPYTGRIEQKGYEYFSHKDVYIRAKLRQDPYFKLLDKESEKALSELSSSPETHLMVTGKNDQGRVLEHLSKCGYIQFGPQGLQYTFDGTFTGVVSVTQKGKNYFSDKENRIEEIIVLGDEAFVVNQIEKQYNVSGNTITGSPFQVGDNNVQNIDFTDYESKFAELKDEVASLKLTDTQIKVLEDLISTANNACKEKNEGVVKHVLKEIWDFAKQAGSNLLAAYLAIQFGLGT